MFDDKKPYRSPYTSALEAIADYEPMVRSALDAKMKNDDSSLTNSIGFSMTADKAYVWLSEPCESILDISFRDKVERILTTCLYPEFVVKHQSGLCLVPRSGDGVSAGNARALVFDLHFGLYDRLVLNSLGSTAVLSWDDSKNRWVIPMMAGYSFDPLTSPHVAIQGNTGSGKTGQIIILNSYCRMWADKTYVESKKPAGVERNTVPTLMVIDPKVDSKLMRFCKHTGDAVYIAPDLTQTQSAYMATVNEALKSVIEEMNYRYTELAKNPNLKFKHLFVTVDECRALLEGASRKAIDAFFRFTDLITLKGRACGISLIVGSQSFLSGKADGCISTCARDNLALRIMLTKTVTVENARFLFKDITDEQAKSLLIDRDGFDQAGVGIISDNDHTVVPYKVPYLKTLEDK